MAETDSELAGLKARLERLERSNRSLRRGSLVALAGVALVAALGAANSQAPKYTIEPPPGVQEIVRAHKFELVDGGGDVKGSLEILDGVAELALHGAKATDSLAITSGGLTVGADSLPNGPAIALGAGGIVLWRGGGEITIGRSPSLSPPALEAEGISIRDASGYETDIGATSLVTPSTGETHQTPAASIVMFGNDKDRKVIWQVP